MVRIIRIIQIKRILVKVFEQQNKTNLISIKNLDYWLCDPDLPHLPTNDIFPVFGPSVQVRMKTTSVLNFSLLDGTHL